MAETEPEVTGDDTPETPAAPQHRADIAALATRARRKREQIERAAEIKREATRREIDSAIPLKTGRLTGSVFAIAALTVILLSNVSGRLTTMEAFQAGLLGMLIFFAIGFFIGHVGHQLVGEFTEARIAEETEVMLGPLPMPGEDEEAGEQEAGEEQSA